MSKLRELSLFTGYGGFSMGDRMASRLFAGNPELSEVSLVSNPFEDYRA